MALKVHSDWNVIVSEGLSGQLSGLDSRKIVDNDVLLPASLRADFIDCSKWVEQAIGRTGASFAKAKFELNKLQNTSMRICVTRDFSKIQARKIEMDIDHPEWKYGILISNFAEKNIVDAALHGWDIGFRGSNAVSNGEYGVWFAGGCKNLTKARSVYGNQGLELDCPIVVFGDAYIRQGGKWITNGYKFNNQRNRYNNPDAIVENNFRVLLTRARKEMILLIPDAPILDETYQYFIDTI